MSFIDFLRCCRRRGSNELAYATRVPGPLGGGVQAVPHGGDGSLNCGTGEPEPVFTYVGRGGRYVPETSYKYVGDGAGEFRALPPKQHPGCRLCLAIFLGLVTVSMAALLVALARYYYQRPMGGEDARTSNWAARSTGADRVPRDPEARYDCTGGYDDPVEAWPKLKKDWCCAEVQAGCERTTSWVVRTTAPTAFVRTTAPTTFDCDAGFQDRYSDWSFAQKAWCCTNAGKGCPTTPPPPSARSHNRAAQHSAGLSGLPQVEGSVPVLSPGAAADSADKQRPQTAAGAAAAAAAAATWHPDESGSASVATLAPSPASGCGAACLVDGQRATCKQRLEYAIKLQFAGRPDSCRLAQVEVINQCSFCKSCELDAQLCASQPSAPATSVQVEQHLVASEGSSPAPVTTPPAPVTTPPAPTASSTAPFDCIAGYANWRRGWSDAKKAWCCKHSRLKQECPLTTTARQPATSTAAPQQPHLVATTFSLPFDCLAGFANWKLSWSDKKKVWCCKHSQRGCTLSSTTAEPAAKPSVAEAAGSPHDCEAGYDDWEARWPILKKAWCCQHKQRGCPPRMTSVPYNCNHRFDHWKDEWSGSKKEWCCRNSGKGCAMPGSGPANYNCLVGYANWESWSSAKKQFCCARVDCRSA